MQKIKNHFRMVLGIVLAASFAFLVTGCAPSAVMLSKRNLDVQTKTSASIFMDPVPDAQKVVYLQIRNTSDRPGVTIEPQIRQSLEAKGYRITRNLDAAHYLLQVNILQVGKTDPTANEAALQHGYGSAVGGISAGIAMGALINDNGTGALAGGLIAGVISTVAGNMVKDVTYSMMTDVQISERTKTTIQERSQANLSQGTSGSTIQSSHTTSHWQRYRTRVLSTAEKVNLSFEQALPQLKIGLSDAISGFF